VDDSILTIVALVAGVALLYLGSRIRQRGARARRPPPQGGGSDPDAR
jgi:hypothetical protein